MADDDKGPNGRAKVPSIINKTPEKMVRKAEELKDLCISLPFNESLKGYIKRIIPTDNNQPKNPDKPETISEIVDRYMLGNPYKLFTGLENSDNMRLENSYLFKLLGFSTPLLTYLQNSIDEIGASASTMSYIHFMDVKLNASFENTLLEYAKSIADVYEFGPSGSFVTIPIEYSNQIDPKKVIDGLYERLQKNEDFKLNDGEQFSAEGSDEIGTISFTLGTYRINVYNPLDDIDNKNTYFKITQPQQEIHNFNPDKKYRLEHEFSAMANELFNTLSDMGYTKEFEVKDSDKFDTGIYKVNKRFPPSIYKPIEK